MKAPKNRNKTDSEIAHIARTVIPILMFTGTAILVCLVIVSWVYNLPIDIMVRQLTETFKSVMGFTGVN